MICPWGGLLWLILTLLIILTVGVTAFNSFWNRYVLDIVIEEKNLAKYLDTLWVSTLGIVLVTLLIALTNVRKSCSSIMVQMVFEQSYFLEKYLKKASFIIK
ncbi:hypothetical protein AB0758_24095 [Tolypothrix bouteillei VB521301_2]|uniref:hypothetical protein n=1 Tax=Tolypothrix bouteillei TaxID=1246981 RepID=UPI0038B57FCA